jgi:uncharacterized membrane protein
MLILTLVAVCRRQAQCFENPTLMNQLTFPNLQRQMFLMVCITVWLFEHCLKSCLRIHLLGITLAGSVVKWAASALIFSEPSFEN